MLHSQKKNIFQIGELDSRFPVPGFVYKHMMGNQVERELVCDAELYEGTSINEHDFDQSEGSLINDDAMTRQNNSNVPNTETISAKRGKKNQENSEFKFIPVDEGKQKYIKEHVKTICDKLGEPYDFLHCLDDGLVLIINNVKFSTNFLTERIGSNADVENIYNLFEGTMGWENIFLYNDETSTGMKNIMKLFSKLDYKSFNSFFLFILTHGNKKGLYGTDGTIVPVSEILEFFTLENCKGLIKKPKIFFFQACRGSYDSNASPSLVTDSHSNVNNDDVMVDFDIYVPGITDYLVCYPCLKDSVAMRSPQDGTVFMWNLIETLNTERCYTDLLNMMIEANFKMTAEIPYKTVDGKHRISFALSNQTVQLSKKCYFLNYFENAKKFIGSH